MNQINFGNQTKIGTINITQITKQFQKDFDVDLLAKELENLSSEMKNSAQNDDEIKSAEAIEKAKHAAKNKDIEMLLTYLKAGENGPYPWRRKLAYR